MIYDETHKNRSRRVKYDRAFMVARPPLSAGRAGLPQSDVYGHVSRSTSRSVNKMSPTSMIYDETHKNRSRRVKYDGALMASSHPCRPAAPAYHSRMCTGMYLSTSISVNKMSPTSKLYDETHQNRSRRVKYDRVLMAARPCRRPRPQRRRPATVGCVRACIYIYIYLLTKCLQPRSCTTKPTKIDREE